MEGYLFHISQLSDTSINLHILSPKLTITITDLHSPHIYSTNDKLSDPQLNTFKNIFHPQLPQTVNLFRSKPIKNLKKSITHLFKEFNSPIEQFIIQRNIKGPCLIKLLNVDTTGDNKNYVSKDNVSFIKHCNMPTISIGVMLINYEKNVITEIYIKNDENCVHEKDECEEYLIELIEKSVKNIDLLLYFNLHEDVLKKINLKSILLCDVYLIAQNLIKARDYSIEELSSNLLNKQSDIIKKHKSDITVSLDLCEKAKRIQLIFEALDVLELSKQISEICGCPLSKSLQNNRAERIEYLLLHELYIKGYLFPYKRGKESTYEGGLVLTPQTGFYENMVLLLDFNSLYPSIIQEFNVCFSTVGLHETNKDTKTENHAILPQLISILVNRRRNIKKLMKKSHGLEYKKLDIRQKAIKLTANSIYGVLGCSFSRFSNYKMASYITEKGRELLRDAKLIAEEQLNMKVIYGDTDSIMIDTGLTGINSNYQEAINCGNALKDKINAKYKNIEIEIDHVFKKLILYAKKKYGALVLNKDKTCIEIKGLDFVRRDFANVASEIAREIFELILIDLECKYTTFYNEDYPGFMTPNTFVKNNGNLILLEKIKARLFEYRKSIEMLSKEKFLLSKKLNKDPSQYIAGSILPHIELALRIGTYRKNDIISYVMGKCPINSKNSSSMSAYHISERFTINYDYYIENQILPCINRILGIFDNISTSCINKLFGIEKTSHVNHYTHQKITIITSCCEKIQEPSRICSHCHAIIPINFIKQKAVSFIRREVRNLYNTEKTCKDCDFVTNNIMLACIYCNSELKYVDKNKKFHEFLDKLTYSFGDFDEVVEYVDKLLLMSDYRVIDLEKYFKDMI